MDLSFITNPAQRAAYMRTQAAPQQAGYAPVPAAAQDMFELSPEAQAAIQAESVDTVTEEPVDPGTVTTFTSFGQEFSKVTQDYSNTVREHYAQEHAENLTYPDPKAHVWDKYKNPESPSFRSDLSEEERAWAYDQELDLLNGGKHLQLGNPYAFPDGAPTLASAAMKASQACREQIGQSIQDLLAQNDIDLPADASFRLTVDSSYTIHVSGLEDEELTESIENALNAGDNGKNLYDHLRITGDTGVDFADGRLAPLDPERELSDEALEEVKKQTCPAYAQYSAAYDPQQKPLGYVVGPGMEQPSQEHIDRSCAAVRMGAPEMLARLRAGEFGDLGNQELVINKNASVDPDGSIWAGTYIQAYAQQTMEARKTIEDYYASAVREDRSFPDPLKHIAEKYKQPWSDIFRSDLSERQRDMYYRQERALLTGARVTLLDPYALASVGGVLNLEDCHSKAMQAAQAKLDALWEEMYGTEA